jgi:hypothetical protein
MAAPSVCPMDVLRIQPIETAAKPPTSCCAKDPMGHQTGRCAVASFGAIVRDMNSMTWSYPGLLGRKVHGWPVGTSVFSVVCDAQRRLIIYHLSNISWLYSFMGRLFAAASIS